jgi:hypothetical protein
MIPITDISLDDVLVETGHSSGIEHEFGALLDEFNAYSTGAVHSANSTRDMGGFSGGNCWHYLLPYDATDYGTYVRLYVDNWSNNDQSGTLYWTLLDSGYNVIASGSQATGSVSTMSATWLDLAYSSGTPVRVQWRWSTSLSFNTMVI